MTAQTINDRLPDLDSLDTPAVSPGLLGPTSPVVAKDDIPVLSLNQAEKPAPSRSVPDIPVGSVFEDEAPPRPAWVADLGWGVAFVVVLIMLLGGAYMHSKHRTEMTTTKKALKAAQHEVVELKALLAQEQVARQAAEVIAEHNGLVAAGIIATEAQN